MEKLLAVVASGGSEASFVKGMVCSGVPSPSGCPTLVIPGQHKLDFMDI